MDSLGHGSLSRARYRSEPRQISRSKLEDKLMRFLKRSNPHRAPADEVKMADMLEAYTCWLKNERLSRKQKRLMKELPGSTDFQTLKQLIDFVHYRFEERATVTPRPGAKESARARLMATIRDEAPEPVYTPTGAEAFPSPDQMGSESTDVLPMGSVPTPDELNLWNKPAERATTPYNAIRTLSRMHLRFEQKDDDVYLTDLESSSSIYVDGERVQKNAPIHDDTTIECGKVTLKVTNIERS